MTDRVDQFRRIQGDLDKVSYTDNFITVIGHVFNSAGEVTPDGRKRVQEEVLGEIGAIWHEVANTQTRTNARVSFNNLEGLADLLAAIQVYASIGHIVIARSLELVETPPPAALSRFQDEARELFARKNADYGDAFADYGIVGVMVRMGDKIARISSLASKDAETTSESVADTYIDLYNYSIMALMLVGDELSESDDLRAQQRTLALRASELECELRGAEAEHAQVTREIRRKCEHEWVRDYGVYCDSHTPHYCKHCGTAD